MRDATFAKTGPGQVRSRSASGTYWRRPRISKAAAKLRKEEEWGGGVAIWELRPLGSYGAQTSARRGEAHAQRRRRPVKPLDRVARDSLLYRLERDADAPSHAVVDARDVLVPAGR